jgi:hypothetical protein
MLKTSVSSWNRDVDNIYLQLWLEHVFEIPLNHLMNGHSSKQGRFMSQSTSKIQHDKVYDHYNYIIITETLLDDVEINMTTCINDKKMNITFMQISLMNNA